MGVSDCAPARNPFINRRRPFLSFLFLACSVSRLLVPQPEAIKTRLSRPGLGLRDEETTDISGYIIVCVFILFLRIDWFREAAVTLEVVRKGSLIGLIFNWFDRLIPSTPYKIGDRGNQNEEKAAKNDNRSTRSCGSITCDQRVTGAALFSSVPSVPSTYNAMI